MVLWIPGWPQTPYIVKDEPKASTFPELGLQACAIFLILLETEDFLLARQVLYPESHP